MKTKCRHHPASPAYVTSTAQHLQMILEVLTLSVALQDHSLFSHLRDAWPMVGVSMLVSPAHVYHELNDVMSE